MSTDLISYSLGNSVTPRLQVFQNLPIDLEMKKKSSNASQYSDYLSELSDDTDVSENMTKSRRYSMMSQGLEEEPFAPEVALHEDDSDEEDMSPTRKTFYCQLVNQLVQ